MIVLAFNAGSSSLKHTVLEMPAGRRVDRGETGGLTGGGHGAAADDVLRALDEAGIRPEAVGHRIVHGGDRHAPAAVDDALLAELDGVAPLAPLHVPPQLEVVRAARRRLPEVAHVACFDTAFHRAMPEIAQRLPVPEELWARGVRRYGFHGLSYEYVLSTLGTPPPPRVLMCHLGAGASMAAVRDGRPVDTTMSFTPGAGLMMATRAGDLDSGLLLHLMREDGMDADALDRLVNRESGLLGVGGTHDMRTLVERRGDDPRADLAVDMFCHVARRHAGAMAASLGGLDVLVFTGGIGEHSPEVRAGVCDGLGHLGVVLDPTANAANAPVVSAAAAGCEVRVTPTDEDLVIARAAARS
ncbi:MAG: acetate/propionate family kinase [Thermoleophilia bacterium]